MYSHESLHRLEDIYHMLVAATLSDKPPDSIAIVALRQRFAIEFGSLLLALGDDLNTKEHRALHDELLHRVKTLRTRLMSYTMAWQPAQIEADPGAYREAARSIADMVWQFIVEARQRLEQVDTDRRLSSREVGASGSLRD